METRTESIPATMSGIEIKGLQHEDKIKEWLRISGLIKEARLAAAKNNPPEDDLGRYDDIRLKTGDIDDRFGDLLMEVGYVIGMYTREGVWDEYLNS